MLISTNDRDRIEKELNEVEVETEYGKLPLFESLSDHEYERLIQNVHGLMETSRENERLRNASVTDLSK